MFKGLNSEELILDLETKDYKVLLAEYDKYIINAMIKREGSIPKAAKKMKVDATTLRRKIDKYNSIT